MKGKDEVTAKQTCSQQFPEMLMKREQSFVRLGTTGQSGSTLTQDERCIHHGIHRITSIFTLEIHSAKIVISPNVATGQKCSQAGIILPFHSLKLCSTFCVTFGLQVPLKAKVCYQEGGKTRISPKGHKPALTKTME